MNYPFYQQPQYQQPQMQMPMYQQTQMNQPCMQSFVADFNQIKASDVPMDGKWVLFGKNDMSEVCAKAWTPQGTISTLEYSLKQPVSDEKVENVPQIDLSSQFVPIMAEIKALNTKIDKLNSKPTNSNAKN